MHWRLFQILAVPLILGRSIPLEREYLCVTVKPGISFGLYFHKYLSHLCFIYFLWFVYSLSFLKDLAPCVQYFLRAVLNSTTVSPGYCKFLAACPMFSEHAQNVLIDFLVWFNFIVRMRFIRGQSCLNRRHIRV